MAVEKPKTNFFDDLTPEEIEYFEREGCDRFLKDVFKEIESAPIEGLSQSTQDVLDSLSNKEVEVLRKRFGLTQEQRNRSLH